MRISPKRWDRLKELIADGLREVGVLLCVFGALDFRYMPITEQMKDNHRYYAIQFIIIGVVLANIGIAIDLWRKELAE